MNVKYLVNSIPVSKSLFMKKLSWYIEPGKSVGLTFESLYFTGSKRFYSCPIHGNATFQIIKKLGGVYV